MSVGSISAVFSIPEQRLVIEPTVSAAKKKIHMLFAGWEVRIVKNCDRGLENVSIFVNTWTKSHESVTVACGQI